MAGKQVRIGCSSAMWGDTPMAPKQLVLHGDINYLIGDYLAELTMSILAAKKMKNPKLGFATDWITQTMSPLLPEIKKRGIKVCTNAGGLNPEGCREALLEVAKAAGIELKVGVVLGDDLKARVGDFHKAGVKELWSGEAFPPKMKILSSNCYLGAAPIAKALAQGCDVVICGRVVDSALALGPLMYEFGWTEKDYDKLSAGTLAGHLVECGAQGTCGLFTDWKLAQSWENIGFPIVEVTSDGNFTISKPPNTDGIVIPASVVEQLVYEIGDPGAYHVPDVACDWTHVKMTQKAKDVVYVTGAKGLPPTDTLKVCTTYADGFKLVAPFVVGGVEAVQKAERVANTLLARTRKMMKEKGFKDYSETKIELFGSESIYGASASPSAKNVREVVCKLAVRHNDKKALDILAVEMASAFVSMSPGLFALGGSARAAATPVIRQFSSLVPKSTVTQKVTLNFGPEFDVPLCAEGGFKQSGHVSVVPVAAVDPKTMGPTTRVPLIAVAHGRSGDKGASVNVGIIARDPELLPFLRYQLTPEAVNKHFAHVSKGTCERFDMPGMSAMNFLLNDALGGGGAMTLNSDALGKAYAQMLLGGFEVDIPTRFAQKMAKL